MTIKEYMEFAFLFLFLAIYIAFAYMGAFKTEQVSKSNWGKSIWRNMKPKQIKIMSSIFLIAGLLFMTFTIGQLATGTFKWRGSPKRYSLSDLFARTKEAKQQQEYQSPDGKYRALVTPLPKAPHGSGESKIELHSKDAVVLSENYGSEDGEHGFGVERAGWTPDSKFFVYSTSSSGGHQGWHFPTYFISVTDFKARKLDDYLGLITNPSFDFIAPDVILIEGHRLGDLEKEIKLQSSLSKLLKK
jgi:hypothetical protein